jgi:hypothetical protein
MADDPDFDRRQEDKMDKPQMNDFVQTVDAGGAIQGGAGATTQGRAR